jgi:DNA-binding cell septation regulator SpoVG
MDQGRATDMQKNKQALLNIQSQHIEILSVSRVKDRGSLQVFVTIRLGSLIINDCRVIQEPGEKTWFSLPVLTYKNQQGTILYKTLVQIIDNDLKNLIRQVTLDAWENSDGESK